jgi:NAD+ synthase (glutamine-hydrolysing)
VKLIKSAVAAVNQTPLDWDGNYQRLESLLLEARRAEVTLLCLPELCVTGYGCEDAFYSPDVQRQGWELLQALLPHTRGMIVSLGVPRLVRGGLYNVAALSVNGQLVGMVAKQHLASDGLHYEPRWFKAWPSGVSIVEQLGEREVPVGDLVFDCGGLRIGFEICEDAWVASRPGSRLMKRGVDVIFNPSASHFAFGKHDVRQRFVLDGSRAFCVMYLYANLLGNEAGRAIYDGDTMIASCGRMLAFGPRFRMSDYQLTTATVDLDEVRVRRAMIGSFAPALEPDDPGVVEVDFKLPAATPDLNSCDVPAWELGSHRKEEEFTRAMTLGLGDYLRKSGSRGFVISLSGGADSAAVATLCALTVERLYRELGPAAALQRLGWPSTLAAPEEARAAIRRLVTCVYQATRHSSDVTFEAARGVAEAIGATFYRWNVDAVIEEYTRLVSTALDQPLNWNEHDLALQNIQARARGPGVWMIANLTGGLLLATSNRSEAAVGYATMDGDTCGGLSPIAGIDKNFLRHWLCWLEATGPEDLFPIPALAAVNRQAPTAELRPREQHQTDEADLMPYELLDAVERAAIRDKQSPADVLQLMRVRFPQYTVEQLKVWTTRFFQLWSRNQWKRERYAPSFHLDDENLDPKTWCRFPILSGGYRRELRRLDE